MDYQSSQGFCGICGQSYLSYGVHICLGQQSYNPIQYCTFCQQYVSLDHSCRPTNQDLIKSLNEIKELLSAIKTMMEKNL